MLTITTQRNSQVAKSYFAADYYSEGQEIVGHWGGKGAVLLGLDGKVEQQAFDRLCDNLHPLTGKQLTAKTREERRVGNDFTFSASKSVSIVHALTGDERIAQAFQQSVNATMREMEADMQVRARKGGADEDRTTGNFAYAEFLHLTSRPVGGLPFPQLHSHCFVFNATFDKHDEILAWRAGQFGKIKHDAFYWQEVQRARFAELLQGLGYGIRRTKDAFEIAGVPDATIKKFSQRKSVIEKLAATLGITDPERKAQLGATTREEKQSEIAYPDLVSRWDAMLTPDERNAISNLRHAPVPMQRRDREHVSFAIDHLFERSSVVAARRLMSEALRHGMGEVTPEGIRQAMKAANLLTNTDKTDSWVTTREVLAEEQRVLRMAATGRGTCRPILSGPLHFADARLNEGQRQAVEHVLRSADKIMIVRGSAGTGKTTLTTEAVRHIEAAGKPVMMLAPSAQASRGTLRDEGFGKADTLSRFLIDTKMQEQARGGVVWLDEAGLASMRAISSLFDVAEKIHARIVLAGDVRQLAAVERGSPLRLLEDLAGIKPVEVTDIRRQNGEFREIAMLLSRGETGTAIEKLDGLGWIKEIPKGNPYGELAQAYVAATRRKESVLVVAPSRAEGQAVTEALREQLRQAGLLEREEHEFKQLVPLHWTEAERADPGQYRGDEVLQFHRNIKGFKAGERWQAADVLPQMTPQIARAFAAYEASTLAISKGDILKITANGKTVQGKGGVHRLNNGATYTVKGFTRGGDIQLHNGWVVAKDCGHIGLGYAQTSHGAQGKTVDRVLVANSAVSRPASSEANFYVAVTRARKSATIFCDSKAELHEAASRSDVRMSATELVNRRNEILRQRSQHVARRERRRPRLERMRQQHEHQPRREITHAR